MARQEQDALLTFFNSFKLAKRVTTFSQLADGKALLEVMGSIDPLHFRGTATRNVKTSPGGPSSENWVLKMNTLKRLYRLLLSYPLPLPHNQLSLSSLPEPNFSAVARSPASPEGSSGLLQICRFCLAICVWASGNEKIIKRIQAFDEKVMAELMRSIEDVMSSLPEEEEGNDKPMAMDESRPRDQRRSSLKPSPDIGSPQTDIQAERDQLAQELETCRLKHDQLVEDISELRINLESATMERDDALSQLSSAREASAGSLRISQTASTEVNALRAALAKAEEDLQQVEAELQGHQAQIDELSKTIDDLRPKAAEAAKLKDQLDEYRHATEKLQKSENILEKYKKKLEDSAGLRRELRGLEQENASLIERNSALEAEVRKVGSSQTMLDGYRSQVDSLEKRSVQQAMQKYADGKITELEHQLDSARTMFEDAETSHQRDKENLHWYQEKVRELEMELGGSKPAGRRRSSDSFAGDTSLGAELGGAVELGRETKTDLKLRIKALERELSDLKVSSPESAGVSPTNDLLLEAERARDRYQADYLAAHRDKLRLHASLEAIRAGQVGTPAESTAALKQEQQLSSDPVEAADARATRSTEGFEEVQKAYESQITTLKAELETAISAAQTLEKRYKREHELMLSAWHDLGSRVVKSHLHSAAVSVGVKRGGQAKVMPNSWLGRQRRYQDDASFSRA